MTNRVRPETLEVEKLPSFLLLTSSPAMHALRVAIQSLLCPCIKILAGVATSAAETDQHAKSFLHRRLHVPLNALTSTIVLSRPITVLVMILWAFGAALLSIVTGLTGWQPKGCPAAEPRTRPRPPRGEESNEAKGVHNGKRSLTSISRSIASSSKGWLGLAKRPARAPLSSPPHTVRLRSMTFHDLEGVEEYDDEEEEEDEDTEMESMIADDQTESDGPSEVDTVSDVAPMEVVSKGKGLFRRRPRRGPSESSIDGAEGEGAPIAKSGSGSSTSSLSFHKACPKARLRKVIARKASQTSSTTSPSSSSSSTSATSSASSSSRPNPSRPPLRNSHSSPALPLTTEPESYEVPPRAAEAPASLSVPSPAPERRRGFASIFANKNRSRDRSPLSSPPQSPQISPRLPPATLPVPALLVSKPQGHRAASPAPDATGRSGLALSDLVGRTRR